MSSWIQILGGIGFFLFGMSLMTSGLRTMVGTKLRLWVARSTSTPLSGVFTGATLTALIQSSSATTIMAIGFVGAGLVSFTSSLGIIFGANIGTTITGWMVALVGFELDLNVVALPLFFIAALFYVFFKDSPKLFNFGRTLAGFCLIFVGIAYLQEGLLAYQDVVDFSKWQTSSFGGRFMLVLAGIVLTIFTQSSSATVVAALTALNTSIVDLPQAAAIIIGADIGTTATAAIATIGGSVAIRRTGFAHVIYNIITGMAAFFVLPLYLWAVNYFFSTGFVEKSSEVIAVAFHSAFNIIGVIVVLPFTQSFARLIKRIFPENKSQLLRQYDAAMLSNSVEAIDSLQAGVRELTMRVFNELHMLLSSRTRLTDGRNKELMDVVKAARNFAVKIRASQESEAEEVFVCLHMLDHLERLLERNQEIDMISALQRIPIMRKQVLELINILEHMKAEPSNKQGEEGLFKVLDQFIKNLDQQRTQLRSSIMQRASEQQIEGEALDKELDSHRWFYRISHHVKRIADYTKLMKK